MATTTVRLPDELKEQATAYAEGLGISLNALMLISLDAYLYQRAYLRNSVQAEVETPKQAPAQSMNSPCACGSGKKYKRCCGA